MSLRINQILLAFVAGATLGQAATIVSVDTSTTLLDASNFTAGTTYYAAWQLTGAGASTNTATLSAFDLGGGAGINRQPGDPVDTPFTLGPNALSTAGVWQLSATLDLVVDPSDSFSLYSQQFVAGGSFAFRVDYTTDQIAGFTPDAFSFQLYDSTLSTLLYEVTLDLLPPGEPIPEPSAWALALMGLGLLLTRLTRRTLL